MLPNNNSSVRKIVINRTQNLHGMRLRQFTPHQPIPDIPITSRERQPDPEVVIKHDDLYSIAWECQYDEPIFDTDYNNLATPSSPESTIRSEQVADETRNTPGTIAGSCLEIIPQPDRQSYGTDTDHDMQPDADTSVEQLNFPLTNPHSSKYDLRLKLKPNCKDDYRYWLCRTIERICTLSGNPRMRYGTDMRKVYILFQEFTSVSEVTLEHYLMNHTNFGICRYWELDPHHITLIYS